MTLELYEKAEKYLVELRYSGQDTKRSLLLSSGQMLNVNSTLKQPKPIIVWSMVLLIRFSIRNMISIFAQQDKLNDALRFLTQEAGCFRSTILYQAQANILKRMDNKKAALHL